jgi:3-methylcrotonyl-CoA carboxylase alpha subunit
VLIKAAAGGGGKGMRRADGPAEFAEALARARSEAQSSFGNSHVLVEKFILNPRHIEVQVFADAHGACVHLFERDCSAQRRHQKVIEEAPAPGMTAALRTAMTDAAVRAAQAVGYAGAGTVEFIVDGSRMTPDAFFFMEMNTRLQVEHPVTEAVTGLDLVEWQLRVAGGEPLPLAQPDIRLTGHALEARIYAEDPGQDFFPQTGRLSSLTLPPVGIDGVRIDSGVAAGDVVTPHYDPMIVKLITHGQDRAVAFAAMSRALAQTDAGGLTTNIGFLERLVREPEVLAGTLDTGLIARRIDPLTAPAVAEAADFALAAAALTGLLTPAPLAGWRAWGPGRTYAFVMLGEVAHTVAVVPEGADGDGVRLSASTPAGEVSLSARPAGGARWAVTVAGATRTLWLHDDPGGVTVARDGTRLRFARADPLELLAEDEAAGDVVSAPLPGILRQMLVSPGDTVAAGAVLAVLEAMKMEHSLTAPRDGLVAQVMAAAGDTLAEGTVLITLEPLAEAAE